MVWSQRQHGGCRRSWVAASLVFFLVIGEPRALLLTQMGIVMIAVPGYAEMFRVATRKAPGPEML